MQAAGAMPKDLAHHEPQPDPETERAMRQVMACPVFRRAVCECVEATADALGLREPIGPEGCAKVLTDPVFQQRLAALTLATLEATEAGA